MSLIFDVIGGLVNVGLKAYQVAQANEAEALRMLSEALFESAAKLKEALAQLEVARAKADEKIAAGWKGSDT